MVNDIEQTLDAALLGNIDAQLKISSAYVEGLGVEKNPKMAWYWAKQASDQHSSWGDFILGGMLIYGDGVDKDHKEAAKLFKRASSYLPEACEMLGHLYMAGAGLRKNPRKAFQYFSKAAAGTVTSAYFCLGFCYQHGKGVKKDTDKAIELYEIAAAKGNAAALVELALLYSAGVAVEKDMQKALGYLQQGSDLGDISSKIRLVRFYLDTSDYKNHEVAFELATELALRGNYFGQIFLGSLYQDGFWHGEDMALAEYWFDKAQKNPFKSMEIPFGVKRTEVGL